MRKGSDLIGKPVVAYDTGEQFEKIVDVIFDQHSNQLLGFLVDEGGWFKNARVLPLRGVQVIGPDAVIVPSKTTVVNSETVSEIHRILERNNVLKGTKIMTTDGRDLGELADLYFDEQSGAIEGYEVTGGVFADAYSGRAFVPAPQTLKIGQDVAFVPPEITQLMEEQSGGIKAAVESAGERLEETASSLTLDQARGRRVQHAVRTEQGLIIAAPGQIVTDQVLARAQTYHKEQELLGAVGMSAGDAARLHARTASQQAGESIDPARAGANNLWDRFKGKVNELQERSSQQIEEQRVNAAIGRPVTRVILDRQDNVILNVGELITHEAISRSREAGVLPMLLDSVYTREPELSPSELRAPVPGEAKLEPRERHIGE
jgi:uncharacterized protein YrrD